MARRITQKMLKENEFVSFVDPLIRWLSDNWRVVVFAFGCLVSAILLWWVVGAWTGSRGEQASVLLNEAQVALTPGTETHDPVAGEEKLREVVERYSGSRQGDVARLYLARIELDRGEVEAARASLISLAEKNTGNVLGQLAALDLVHLRIASGEGVQVANELMAVVTGEDQGLARDLALYELAMLLMDQERFDEAKEYFQNLVDEFPESPYRFPAQQRLSELG